MDRKNQRAAGAVSTVPAVASLTGDDAQDEAVIWKRTLAHLQQLSEIIEANDGVIVALDKAPEGIAYMSVRGGGRRRKEEGGRSKWKPSWISSACFSTFSASPYSVTFWS